MTPTPHDYQTLSLAVLTLGTVLILGVWVGRAVWGALVERWRPRRD